MKNPSPIKPPVTGNDLSQTPEDLLAEVGQARSREAFIRLFEHFAPRLKSFLMRGGFNSDIADELAQETMLAVWDKAASYNAAKAAASTWIFTIARNKRIDYMRRPKLPELTDHELDQMADSNAAADLHINHAEEATALAKAMKDLPPEQAELIQKAFFEEKTHSDIAAETNLPLGTVKSRIRLALDRMRLGMKEFAT